MDMVVPPGALIAPGSQLRLHALYYITKQIIPALERLLSLVGADIRAWFTALPRPQRLLPQKRLPRGASGADAVGVAGVVGTGRATLAGSVGGTIDRYYLSRHCAVRTCAGIFASLSPALCTLGPAAGKPSADGKQRACPRPVSFAAEHLRFVQAVV